MEYTESLRRLDVVRRHSVGKSISYGSLQRPKESEDSGPAFDNASRSVVAAAIE